jgi:DNA mismatch endonuclease, patch repair protein
MDCLTPEQRHYAMSQVRSKDTAPEMVVRRLVHGMGYRYHLHVKTLPGCPDLVFPARRKVIFIHGCWWHGHDCPRGARAAKINAAYWERKIRGNAERDAVVHEKLTAQGWETLVVWECMLRDKEQLRLSLVSFLGKRNA